MNADERLRRILKMHFDPAQGSRYWIERAARLGFDPVLEIGGIDGLWKLGPMDLDALAERPVEDFVPSAFLKARRPAVLAETGGATGDPKSTVYFEDEFRAVFVEAFLRTADAAGFRRDGHWLYVGPGGPHVIGKAAAAIAKASGSYDAFSVDFDPRWYRTLAAGSFARERYLAHVVGQAARVLSREKIGCLFSTPVVLSALAERTQRAARESVKGVYLGGMAVEPAVLARLAESFPGAAFVSGYGNTLSGVCHSPENLRGETGAVRYFPHGSRLVLKVVSADPALSPEERIRTEAAYGEEGQVMFHRLDESAFLPNVLERDRAVRTECGDSERKKGFDGDGISDPRPLEAGMFKVDAGIY